MSESKMTKKLAVEIVIMATIILLTIWAILVKRVNDINRIPIKYYSLEETISYSKFNVVASDFTIESKELFEKNNGELSSIYKKGDKIVNLKFIVTNTSQGELEIDEVFPIIMAGFETKEWMSSVDPDLCSKINRYESKLISSGESIEVSVAANVSGYYYKGKLVENETFDYTLSIYPRPIRIKLGRPVVLEE